jgi:hypothetical protein
MEHFTQGVLEQAADLVFRGVSRAFPDHKWAVLPEVAGDLQAAGFVIFTTAEHLGPGVRVVCRPRVSLDRTEHLGSDEQVAQVCAAFEKALTGKNERFLETGYHGWVLGANGQAPIETLES